MKKQRVELHCQTNDICEGTAIISPLDSIRTAIEMGMPGIGFADYFSVNAFPEIYTASLVVKTEDAPFKILYGVNLGVFDDSNLIRIPTDAHNILKQDLYGLVLFAKNEQGIRDIFHLVTNSNYSETGILPMSEIEKVRENFIIGGSCRSQLHNRFFLDEIEYLIPFYEKLDYIEIEPAENLFDNGFTDEFENLEELKSVIKEFVEVMERIGKKVVAVTNVQYKDPSWETAFRAVREKEISADDGYHPKHYWMPTQELLDLFGFLGKKKAEEVVIKNSLEIFHEIGEVRLPLEESFHLDIKGADRKLKTLCKDEALKIYGKTLPVEVRERMERELHAIVNNGFSSVYLVAHNLAMQCRDAKIDIATKGSAAASFVAFLAGITEINPLPAHYLCPNCYYTEFVEKCGKKYSIGTAGLDYPDKKCPKCGKKMKKDGFDIPWYSFMGYHMDRSPFFEFCVPVFAKDTAEKFLAGTEGVGEAYHFSWRYRYDQFFAEEMVKQYLELKEKKSGPKDISEQGNHIRGKAREEYVDPCIVVLTPKGTDITDYTPIAPSPNFEDDVPCACLADAYMFVKLPTFGIQQDYACDILEDLVEITGKDLHTIPLRDKKILSLLSSSDALGMDETLFEKVKAGADAHTGTCGIPGLESSTERKFLQLVNPENFSDLIKFYALGSKELKYFDSLSGPEKDEALAKKAAHFREGVAVREDVFLYLLSVGIEAETAVRMAEDLRKGKFKRLGLKPEWKTMLEEHGVPDWYIESMKETDYLFQKGGCISQAFLAWRLLYFKLYKPEAFYKAWLMHNIWDIDKKYWKKDAAIKRYNTLRKKKNLSAEEEFRFLRISVVAEAYARGVDMERIFNEL